MKTGNRIIGEYDQNTVYRCTKLWENKSKYSLKNNFSLSVSVCIYHMYTLIINKRNRKEINLKI